MVGRAYAELVTRLKRIGALGDASQLLQWDQETCMPPGGTEARAAQLSAISSVMHELFTAPEVGRLLASAEKEETDDVACAQLRETRIQYDRATRVPIELVEAISRASSRALPKWVEARSKSDFAIFRPLLTELIELKGRYAAAVEPGAPAYETLFRDFEPWIPFAQARANLAALRDGLKPIIQKHAASGPAPAGFAKDWTHEKQMRFNMRALEVVGYDLQHGRLDVSAHPFSSGGPYDARITTRHVENDPVRAVLPTLHEFGHALYMLGLPKEHHNEPVGDARDLSVHESQSRLWENHVGRSRAFWEMMLPWLQQEFPASVAHVSVEDCYRAANDVRPSFIRVNADELTYHMHIALRFEIEGSLLSGKLKVDEIPAAWNESMRSYLGITPPDDAQGCLQDVHWAHGGFGYFPTYSLGSMLAAQLWSTYAKSHDAEALTRRGEFAPLRGWLHENVHKHGKRYKTDELIERATGRKLSADALVAHAKKKFA